jgi:hypothetical protein
MPGRPILKATSAIIASTVVNSPLNENIFFIAELVCRMYFLGYDLIRLVTEDLSIKGVLVGYIGLQKSLNFVDR